MKKLALILISVSLLSSCAHKYGSSCHGEKAACTQCKVEKDSCSTSTQKCSNCKDREIKQ